LWEGRMERGFRGASKQRCPSRGAKRENYLSIYHGRKGRGGGGGMRGGEEWGGYIIRQA